MRHGNISVYLTLLFFLELRDMRDQALHEPLHEALHEALHKALREAAHVP